ncbi:MAG: hypothetical protein L3J93_04545 [Thermoplasmata archaeon]|nr:hypothetical protein [Thermoplasmata archaeon]
MTVQTPSGSGVAVSGFAVWSAGGPYGSGPLLYAPGSSEAAWLAGTGAPDSLAVEGEIIVIYATAAGPDPLSGDSLVITLQGSGFGTVTVSIP